MIAYMNVLTGKVVSGKVVVEGSPLPEGAKVTILVRDEQEGFTLGPDDEAALLASIEEADRGETVDAEAVLRKLDGED